MIKSKSVKKPKAVKKTVVKKKEIKEVDNSGKILVIVESPGKINKIQHILGDDYIVMASIGHIIELKGKEMSIDFNNNFEPQYQVSRDKTAQVEKLLNAMKKCSDVLLATDEDREGEMIAWSLAYVLGLKNPKRIVFNSITEKEILNAVKSPKEIDMALVDSQKARRVLDRIIGFEITPILWHQIGGDLSTGRVQCVVVRLLVEREKEIKKFFEKETNSFFTFTGQFVDSKKNIFNAILNKTTDDSDTDSDESSEEENDDDDNKKYKDSKARIKDYTDAKDIIKKLSTSEFKLASVETKNSTRQPSPPFTTSTLQQEASRKFGFSVKKTMTVAQALYEAGHITYMRTDSVNLSDEALNKIAKFVKSEYGDDYYTRRQYKSKKTNTQEAHEAIRPTDMNVKGLTPKNKIENDHIKLYTLIWKRAVASQMAAAKLNIKTIQIDISKLKKFYFTTQVQTIVFDGFLAVYNVKAETNENEEDEDKSIALPKIGSKIEAYEFNSVQEYEKPVTRYNEASLINKLDPKNLNIGRPSTYATIIKKIEDNKYVKETDVEGKEKTCTLLKWNSKNKKIEENEKTIYIGKETKRLVPTELAIIITDFLLKNFPAIMEYKFTSSMEDDLDKIAEGKKIWHELVGGFYTPFHKTVETLKQKKTKICDDNVKVLGKDPKSGKKIVLTLKKYGWVVMYEGEKNMAPIKPPDTPENLTISKAINMLAFPKELGKYDNKKLLLKRGQYGYYVTFGTNTITLNGLDFDIDKIDEDDTLESIHDFIKKQLESRNKACLWTHTEGNIEYKVLNGQYGAYVNMRDKRRKEKTYKGYNVSLGKNFDLDDITFEKINKIVEDKKNQPKKKYFPKKKKQ